MRRAELAVQENAERLLASKQFNMSDNHTAQWTAGKQRVETEAEKGGEQKKDKHEKRWEVKKIWNIGKTTTYSRLAKCFDQELSKTRKDNNIWTKKRMKG